jgi:hypothetical protein
MEASREAAMPEDWRKQLIEGYPALFRRVVHGREMTTGYPTVEAGWRGLIETAVTRIDNAVAGFPPGCLSIVQIKEKLGGLRIYCHCQDLPEDVVCLVREAVDLAEARAACTCEICGMEGQLHDRAGWLATRCAMHAVGHQVVHRRDHKNLHIRWAVENEQWRVLSCRRYDRDRDELVDVPIPHDL